jgi:uncharacterized membrane protein YraQ (UPF0718 family)
MKTTEQSYTSWYFLGIVILAYIIVLFIEPEAIVPSLKFFLSIITKIIPVFIVIFILLVLFDLFITPKTIVKHLGENAGVKGWIYSIIGGILSTGPIYMWYPLLNDMQKKGVNNGFIATFLYNRALKPALLPLFIYYFGLLYVVVLSIVMVIVSVLQGFVVDKFVGKNE